MLINPHRRFNQLTGEGVLVSTGSRQRLWLGQVEKLSPEIAGSIRSGQPLRGMTKEQVLMARGYPPGHETPSLDGDRWTYWSSRLVKHTLVFTDGRLSEGRGLPKSEP